MTIAYDIYDLADTIPSNPDCGHCGETDCPDCGAFSLLPPAISLSDAIDSTNMLAIQASKLAERCREQSGGLGMKNHRAGNLAEAAAVSLQQAAEYLNRAMDAAEGEC